MSGNAVLAHGNERFASRCPLQRQLDRVAQLRGHVDQRVQGEFLGAAFYQVISNTIQRAMKRMFTSFINSAAAYTTQIASSVPMEFPL